jgi:uncharacterized membrane protein YhhN
MLTAALSLLVMASALLAVRAECRGPRRYVYLFKPLTVFLIILVALQTKFGTPGAYKSLVVAGLLFSLAGDVCLMLPRDRFVQGLVSFLVAHVFYVAAFTVDGARSVSIWAGVVLAVYGALMLGLLWPRLGRLRGPVVVYVAVILLMAWQAANRWLITGPPGGGLAAAGAVLFVASDSLLAWNRFKKNFRAAQRWVLGTYFVAQWLIALST